MKILVDRDKLQEIIEAFGKIRDYNQLLHQEKIHGIATGYMEEIDRLLLESLEDHRDSELKFLREEMDKMRFNPVPCIPDPRCDGCEYQHPYLENMRLDELSNNVYCTRGSHPPYYKKGKTIQYDPALKLCHKLTNNSWVNPTNKSSDITDEDRRWADKEIEKHTDTPYLATEMIIDGLAREFNNKQAILEILDMLICQEILRVANSQVPDIKSLVWIKAEELKAKLKGEK